MANLTIAVDEQIIQLARMRATHEGTSLSAKVREFLQQYVRSSNAVVAPSLPVFKGGNGLQVGINPSSNHSMLEALER